MTRNLRPLKMPLRLRLILWSVMVFSVPVALGIALLASTHISSHVETRVYEVRLFDDGAEATLKHVFDFDGAKGSYADVQDPSAQVVIRTRQMRSSFASGGPAAVESGTVSLRISLDWRSKRSELEYTPDVRAAIAEEFLATPGIAYLAPVIGGKVTEARVVRRQSLLWWVLGLCGSIAFFGLLAGPLLLMSVRAMRNRRYVMREFERAQMSGMIPPEKLEILRGTVEKRKGRSS